MAEDAQRAGARTVAFGGPVLQDVAEKVQILTHK
jgi:hypothetical protein